MNILDDNYYSDDEWNESFSNPNKVVVFTDSAPKIEDVINEEISYEHPDDFNKKLRAFEELKKYASDNALEILDKCIFEDFEKFIG